MGRLSAVCVFVIATVAAQGQITLTLRPDGAAGKDAVLYNCIPCGYNNTNYGSHPGFELIAWTNGGNNSDARGLVEFDLSSIPANSIVSDARLSLYNDPNAGNLNGQHSTQSGSNASAIQRITSSWNEMTVTWDTQPTSTTQNEVIIPQSTNVYQDYPDIDVTAMVQDMVDNPSTSFGFLGRLLNEVEYRGLVFGSSDNTDSTNRPKLVVTYTVCNSPVAGFEEDASNGYPVQFTDTSNSATSWWWDFGDNQFSNLQNPLHTYNDTGWYYVCLTITDSCGSDTFCDSVYVSNPIGIRELGRQQWSIHPNPSTGVFTVGGATGTIAVLDIFGRLVLTTTEPQIDMSHQTKGIYFVKAGQLVRKLILH